ncbi:PAS domain-containing protein [Rufibacter latericius]|uniref:Oxygen sensor histidine kinase NreB n=1 Tax=Rufibacter latericius TaxID=2487040 RepID=A0A3M9MKT7_9BACT|nr:PAS domain-containing protein [Rufibacter latericius]RNI25825.1 PAS domain S-box protein [Rufibacter latericius]
MRRTQERVNSIREPSALCQILEAAPDLYLILSPDLRIQMVTEAYLTATLSRREDLLGKYVFDAFPANPDTPLANSVENLQASFQQVLETKKPHQITTQHYDVPKPLELGGGFEEKYWSAINTPVLNEEGEVLFIINKIIDVTASVKSQAGVKSLLRERNALQEGLEQAYEVQQKLQEEDRRLKEAQAIGHIGSFESVLQAQELYWSDELYRIFGLEPQSEQATFEKFSGVVHPADKTRFEEAMRRFYQSKGGFDLTYRILRADQQTRVVHTRATVYFDAGGQEQRVHGTVQDITEQMLAQEKLEASEALLRQAEAVGHTGSYEADVATRAVRFSDEMYRLLGHEPNSVEPTPDWVNSITHPDDVPLINKLLEDALKNRHPYQYIRRIYWPNGQMRYIEGKGRIVCDAQGEPLKFLGTVYDITDQIRTDLILNTINEVCFELDEQLRFKFANRKALEAWFKREEEVLGKSYFEVLPQNQDTEMAQVILSAVQKREQVLQRVHSPEEDKWYFYNVTPSPTGVIVLYFDITDRVKARLEIKKQQDQFQLLVENMPSLISRWGEDCRLVYCNPNFEAKLGLVPGVGLGRTNQEMGLPPEVTLPFRQSLEEVFSTGQPQDHTCTLLTSQGKISLLSRLVPEGKPEGRVESVLVIAHDITHIKKAEEEIRKHLNILQQAEEMVGMGSWEYDIASGEITWSEGLSRLLEVDRNQGSWSQNFLVAVVEEDKPIGQRIIEALLQNPHPFEETVRVRTHQGIRKQKMKGIVVTGSDGKPAKVLGVNWDITEMQRLEEENLAIRLGQQKELLVAILNTQEEERRRIAEGLHNGIAQLLYAAKLNLGQVIQDEYILQNKQLLENTSKTDAILEKAIQQTRSLSHELIPTPLSDLGLAAALKDVCSTLSSKQLKIKCWVFNLHTPLEKHMELAVYRIAQELANNIVKHADATQAGLLLREQRGALVLEAEDNGKGFVPGQLHNKGLGLKSIHDRVKLLNGTIEIDSAPGQGTTVSISLPLSLPEPAI